MALTFKFRADGSGYQRGLEKMRTQTQKWTGGIKGMIAGAFAFGSIVSALRNMSDRLDEVTKAARLLNTTTQEMEKLVYISKKAKVEFEDLKEFISNVNERVFEGSIQAGHMRAEWEALGITSKELKNNSPLEVISKLSDAFKSAGDKSSFAAAGIALFGDDFKRVINVMEMGGGKIGEIGDQASTTSDSVKRSIQYLNQTWIDLKNTFSVVLNSLLTGFKALVAMATQTVIEVGDAVDSVGRAIKASVKGNFSGAADIMEKAVEKARTAGKRINEAMHDADGGPATGGSGGGGYGGSGSSGAGENDPANERLKIERQISEEIKKQKEATMTMAEKAKSAKEEWAKLQDAAYDAAEKAEKSGSEEDKTAAARAELAREQAYSKYQQAKKQADAQRGRELQAMDEADQRRIKAQADAQAQAEAQAAEDNKRGDEVYAEAQREAEANKAPLATSVISSSLASIGGGGGVAAFTNDPAVIEAQKQTKLLEEIKTALQPAAGINTNGRPEL